MTKLRKNAYHIFLVSCVISPKYVKRNVRKTKNLITHCIMRLYISQKSQITRNTYIHITHTQAHAIRDLYMKIYRHQKNCVDRERKKKTLHAQKNRKSHKGHTIRKFGNHISLSCFGWLRVCGALKNVYIYCIYVCLYVWC